MAENETGQERTEQPTQKRLQDARDKGEVLRSKEFNTLIMMLGVSVALSVAGGYFGNQFVKLIRGLLSIDPALAMDRQRVLGHVLAAAREMIVLQLPLFGVVVIAAFIGPALLGGIRIGSESMNLKWQQLNPIKGVGRMFSLYALLELAKTLLKVLWLALVIVMVGSVLTERIVHLSALPVAAAVQQALSMIAISLFALTAALVPIAAIDLPHQIWQYLKKLRMTRQEMRDEHKELEGKPEVKGRVRQLQRELANRRMMEAVPTADVVITNPSHYAVALRYDPEGQGAPIVVARGVDAIAARIREIACAHNVPLFAAPPLARAIYFSTKLDHTIPAGLYVAVARVLAYIFQLRASTGGPFVVPDQPTDLPVPDEFLKRS